MQNNPPTANPPRSPHFETSSTLDGMADIGFLDGDHVTNEGRIWYLDVCDGQVELHELYAPIFDELRRRQLAGTFYESATMAYVYEFARVQARFAAMVAELEGDD